MKRSRWAWIMGMIPDPPPRGSPARRLSRAERGVDLESNPEMIEEVGEVDRPLRLGFEFVLYGELWCLEV